MLASTSRLARCQAPSSIRWASTSDATKYKVVIVGGGSGGLSVAGQIYDRFKAAGKPLNNGDIVIVDAAEYHNYQPGWTLVGAGIRPKTEFRRSLASVIPKHISHIPENVSAFSPKSNSIIMASGRTVHYDALVVAAGLQVNWDNISDLSSALADSRSGVSSIYSYDTCDKVWDEIEGLRSGNAVFTQPAGVIKCAGAPQKIMWMAWDRYRRTGRSDKVKTSFYTGMPTMFSVPKYSEALDALRTARGVHGHFQHNLISVDAPNHKATFATKDTDGKEKKIVVDYTILHVVPPMGPLKTLKESPLADEVGWIAVDPASLRHTNPEYGNVFAIGDCSSLPTSKTAAAITAQAPILTENLFAVMDTGSVNTNATYDGYTSCPLLTGYGELMLAEFKYGLVPKETFGDVFDQTKSRRLFYHLKKDLFPWVYFNAMIKGKWFGNNGFRRPSF